MIAKVNAGDRLRISASDWNAIADSVNASDLGTGQARRSRGLFIYNGTDGDLQAGLCLKAGTAGNAASDDYAEMPVVPYAVPTNGEIGCMYIVTAEDVRAGDIGRVVMAGPCYALFSQYDAAMPCAVPDGGGKLKSSWTGDIRVVYADSVKKQGVVLIGAAAGGEKGMFDLSIKDDRVYLYNSIEHDTPDYVNPRQDAGVVQVPSRNLNVPELSCYSGYGYIILSIVFSHENSGINYSLSKSNSIPAPFVQLNNSWLHQFTLAKLDDTGRIHRLVPKGIIRMDGVWA